MGRGRQFSPPPEIFAGAHARPETGMDFSLAFMTPRSQTANVVYKWERAKYMASGWDILFIFFDFFQKRFRVCRQGTVWSSLINTSGAARMY